MSPTSIIASLRMLTRYATGLPPFLRSPLTLEESAAIVSQRLHTSALRFLGIIRHAVFENHGSPYLALMRMAGCEYGDIEHMVQHDGLNAMLAKLAQSGVWLSFEEFKARKPIVRGSWSYELAANDFDNPLAAGQIEARSGGSTGPGTRTAYDLSHLALARTTYKLLTFDAHGMSPYPVVMWSPVAPGYGPLELLAHAKAGKAPVRWFTTVKEQEGYSSTKNHFINRFTLLAGRIAGVELPSPVHAPPTETEMVALCIQDVRTQHGGCIVLTDPSNAVRVCSNALARSTDMSHVLFMIGGEPVTLPKLSIIRKSGAECSPLFVFIEGGYVGIGCLNPEIEDEVHLLQDSIAAIQHKRYIEHANETVDAFLFTTLLPTAPKLLINVESGDSGTMTERDCDCYFGRLGFTEHISHIRSFDKLTSAGMNVTASSFLELAETVLPAAFGGSLLDYQFLEEEDMDGLPRITIVVNPNLGRLDEDALIQTVIDNLASRSQPGSFASQVWAQSNTLRVRREPPSITARGKLLPLHVKRNEEP
ncbi:MAG: hypothetical protein JW846_07315 [Dehalococcoidia bacterium]|nr:hypothetical protein [Dehalococcoidia bacterium]